MHVNGINTSNCDPPFLVHKKGWLTKYRILESRHQNEKTSPYNKSSKRMNELHALFVEIIGKAHYTIEHFFQESVAKDVKICRWK